MTLPGAGILVPAFSAAASIAFSIFVRVVWFAS